MICVILGLSFFRLLSGKVLRELQYHFLGKMSGAALVAIAAAIGNLLQGWDNATIAGNLY